MSRFEDLFPKRRLISAILCTLLLVNTLFFGISFQTYNSQAASVTHNVGNVDIPMITDYGRFLQPISWDSGGYQTVRDGMGFGFIGLVIDQDFYNHAPGFEDIAESYDASFPYAGSDDFQPVTPISFLVNDGVMQKSFGSFKNAGLGTGDPNDILVNQTTWTILNKDWIIIQYQLSNLKPIPLTGVSLGLEIPISKVGALGSGPGGDNGDDIDGFDAPTSTYWAQDNGGTTIGFASALTSVPLNHYYGQDYQADYSTEYINFFKDEGWLYQRLKAPNSLATNGVTPKNITTTVGWNNFDILAGESKTLTLVIAVNSTFNTMKYAIQDAQSYYYNVATGFRITEIEDSGSGSPQIELFNFGRPQTDLSAICTLTATGGALTGSFSPTVIPSLGYSVFTPNENINSEGDIISLYDSGNLVDRISFGTNGIAPDPLDGESVERYYDASLEGYTDSWLRNSSMGPTWGLQNDVLDVDMNPSIVLNEVMFNPSLSDGGYIVLMNNNPIKSINIRGYRIVGDSEYQIPDNADLFLEPLEKYIIGYPDDPPMTSNLFNNMNPSSDNVYLYSKNGMLLDMVGWNTPHLQGMSVRRVPDGSGKFQGYDDFSSQMAGWSFNSPLEVIITEFSDTDGLQSQIEIYNPYYPKIDFTNGFSFNSDSRGALSGIWVTPIAQSDGYAVFDVTTPLGLASNGDSFRLYQNGNQIEEISYGTDGVVPDPLADESVQKVIVSGNYSEFWSRNSSTGPSFGALNDALKPNFNSTLILNEVLFNPTIASDGFLEVYVIFSSLDISGYKIVGNSEYIIPQGTQVTAVDSFFYLDYAKDAMFFNTLVTQGDNVYLYDRNGALLDMVGWTSQHQTQKSICRVPNGNGTRDGFDDPSSILAGWKFNCNPTIQLVKIIPDKKTAYGNFSGSVYYILTLENKHLLDDTVYIFNTTLNGYTVEILDETGSFKISQISILTGSSVKIRIWVELPSTIPFFEIDNITIDIQSQFNPLYRDSITLKAVVTPFIWPEKYAQPIDIFLEGTGYDETSTITLNLTGMGSAIDFVQPQEVIFCVDTSGSMSLEAIDLIKIGLIGYVDKMQKPDKGAVVVFNSGAWIMNPLTDNYTQLRDDIQNIPAPAGSTSMGEALEVAINEFMFNGNSSFLQVIILLTDGVWNGLIDPLDMAQLAASKNINIFTIGLEPAPGQPPLDEVLLQQIADITGGMYFYAADASQIPEIYMIIAAYIGNLAGRDFDITDSVPMVRDVLPPWITLVWGSFSIVPETNYINDTGYRILEWNISQISIGESWEVTFSVKSTRLGWVYANHVDSSRVFYMDYFDQEVFKLFPECTLNVSPPGPLPPRLYIDILPNKEDIFLYWDEPISPGTDHYLIYIASTPTGFDFSTPWIDTSLDIDPLDPSGFAKGNRLTWNHTKAAKPGDGKYSQQWYYCIRSVNILDEVSSTSRTVGKWTRIFNFETSTFSLPLEPIFSIDTEFLTQDMNANYIKWMDPAQHIWVQHDKGEVGDNMNMEVGKGYEVNFPTVGTVYTFLGMPGSHINYRTGSYLGFDPTSEASSLNAVVNIQGDVTLTWGRPSAMGSNDIYNIYRSSTRDGFFEGMAVFMTQVPYGTEMWIDYGVATANSQYYYMIVPESNSSEIGAASYSIGVVTQEYSGQYDTVGIPLIPDVSYSADWYCDNVNSAVGINYFIHTDIRWGWHSTVMPEGAFDPQLLITEGYQISTSSDTKLSFVGR
jgi:uncharacterized protein YegL